MASYRREYHPTISNVGGDDSATSYIHNISSGAHASYDSHHDDDGFTQQQQATPIDSPYMDRSRDSAMSSMNAPSPSSYYGQLNAATYANTGWYGGNDDYGSSALSTTPTRYRDPDNAGSQYLISPAQESSPNLLGQLGRFSSSRPTGACTVHNQPQTFALPDDVFNGNDENEDDGKIEDDDDFEQAGDSTDSDYEELSKAAKNKKAFSAKKSAPKATPKAKNKRAASPTPSTPSRTPKSAKTKGKSRATMSSQSTSSSFVRNQGGLDDVFGPSASDGVCIKKEKQDDSDGSDYSEKLTPKKNGKTPRTFKERKQRDPRPKLQKWTDEDWKNAVLGIVYACGEEKVSIPFEAAARFINEHCSGSALQQALLKLRAKNLQEGKTTTPPLKMSWTRAKKGGDDTPSTPLKPKAPVAMTPKAIKIEDSSTRVQKKVKTNEASSQCLVVRLRIAPERFRSLLSKLHASDCVEMEAMTQAVTIHEDDSEDVKVPAGQMVARGYKMKQEHDDDHANLYQTILEPNTQTSPNTISNRHTLIKADANSNLEDLAMANGGLNTPDASSLADQSATPHDGFNNTTMLGHFGFHSMTGPPAFGYNNYNGIASNDAPAMSFQSFHPPMSIHQYGWQENEYAQSNYGFQHDGTIESGANVGHSVANHAHDACMGEDMFTQERDFFNSQMDGSDDPIVPLPSQINPMYGNLAFIDGSDLAASSSHASSPGHVFSEGFRRSSGNANFSNDPSSDSQSVRARSPSASAIISYDQQADTISIGQMREGHQSNQGGMLANFDLGSLNFNNIVHQEASFEIWEDRNEEHVRAWNQHLDRLSEHDLEDERAVTENKENVDSGNRQ